MPKKVSLPYPSSFKGFTLVEILVVIGIITILSALVITALNPAQLRKAARDTNRKKDISLVSQALEQYYADNNNYPTVPSGSQASQFNCLVGVLTGADADCSAGGNQTGTSYIKSISTTQSEVDPEYCYTGTAQDYIMCVPLESQFDTTSIGGDGSSACTPAAPTGSAGATPGTDFGLYCIENPF